MRRIVVLLLIISALAASNAVARGMEFLTFDELRSLANSAEPTADEAARLDQLLMTPLIVNDTNSTVGAGQIIRIAFWNINEGLEWPMIEAALRDPREFKARVEQESVVSEEKWRKAANELADLRSADVIILNEVDLGMPRTAYANVAGQLAGALGMNYAYGVEFVELGPFYDSTEYHNLDRSRYRGLHGNAVLSRFPIRAASVHRLPDCYDWFERERISISTLERAERWTAEHVMGEHIVKQVRRGGRMALIVELDTGASNQQRLTVVSTHLEDRTSSSRRCSQMRDLLEAIRSVDGTVVIGADLNSSGHNGAPATFRGGIEDRVTSRQFWAQHSVDWFVPGISLAWQCLNRWKNRNDPTAVNIPVIARNKERALFEAVRNFRFSDGGQFDFDGKRTLADTNERASKGFRPTRQLDRRVSWLLGNYRLDWIFVKPAHEGGGNKLVRAQNPQTLRHLNDLPRVELSDHCAITVDLKLNLE